MMNMMKEKINNYWSSDVEGYQKAVKRELGSKKKEWQKIFDEVLGQEKLQVLDVGTGPGVVSIILSGLGHKVTGLDFSREMLEKAKENISRHDRSVELVRGDAENLPFKDELFDAVVNRHVLFTLPNPAEAVGEWSRVLKPGGRIVIVDGDFYGSLDNSLKTKVWRYVGTLLILATERRWSTTPDSEVEEGLPLTDKARPLTDVELLEKAGFQEINVVEDISRRVKSFFEYLKSGYWGNTFLVTGVKNGGK